MPTVEDFFPPPPSKYLKHSDLAGRELIVTIKGVSASKFQNDDGSEQTKPILHFEETSKALVVNKTNFNALGLMLGPESDEWAGAKIALYPTRVDFKGRMVDSIRIKRAASARAQAPAGGDRPFDDQIPTF
jgi:hypothetical protein